MKEKERNVSNYKLVSDEEGNFLHFEMTTRSILQPLFFITDNFKWLDANDITLIKSMLATEGDVAHDDADCYDKYEYSYKFEKFEKIEKFENFSVRNIEFNIYKKNTEGVYSNFAWFKNKEGKEDKDKFFVASFNFNFKNDYVRGFLFDEFTVKNAYKKYFFTINGFDIYNINIDGDGSIYNIKDMLTKAIETLSDKKNIKYNIIRLSTIVGEKTVVVEARVE